jgi:hypothetical protein
MKINELQMEKVIKHWPQERENDKIKEFYVTSEKLG